MKRIALLVAVYAATLVSPGRLTAQEQTGVKLLKECEAATNMNSNSSVADQMNGVHCAGYLGGVQDSYNAWKTLNDEANGGVAPPACVPLEATRLELAKVVVKWLNEHPNKLHKNYATLVMLAFSDAYPCPVTKKQ